MIEKHTPVEDAEGRSLLSWDISDAEEQWRIIDVRDWDTIAVTVEEDKGANVTWDDILTMKWSTIPSTTGAVDFRDPITIDSSGPSVHGVVSDIPYVVLQPPATTPDAGTKVKVHVYLTRGGMPLLIL